MQEINLLQNKVKDRTLAWDRNNRIVMIVFGLILVIEAGAIGGLWYLAHNTQQQIDETVTKNQQIQTQINSNQQDLSSAKDLQAQLQNVTTLLNNHVYWSAFFDELQTVTPVKVQFNSINGSDTDDKFSFTGEAASYLDVGKLILALTTSNKFTDVKLNSVSPGQGTNFGYNFSVDVTVNKTIFSNQQTQ